MGRGGGSHGGGGHSGGRSFGGRSGGGFRGGGRGGSGGPGFGRPGFGGPRFGRPGFGGPPPGGPGFGGPGFGGPPPGGPRWRWGGPLFPGGGYRSGGPGRGGGGCFSAVLVFLLLLFLLRFFIPFFSSGDSAEVTVSRTERTAVTGTETSPEWYIDEPGYIGHADDLTDGLKYFYSKTGIQPLVMLLDYDPSFWADGTWNENAAEQYLAQVYADTFSDNGHLIFAYFSCENDSVDMNGTFYFYYGSAAYSIMDAEAESIFWSYFDMNYNNLDLSIEEFLGQTFRETADNIMHTGAGGTSTLLKAGAVFGAVCIVMIIVGILVARRAKKKEEYL